MSESRREYLDEVRRGIQQALCLLDYPSPHVVGYTKPVIETEPAGHPLMAAPVVFSRSPQEACLIEHSINASRISFKFQVQDDLERCILATYLNHVMQRWVLQRAVVPSQHGTACPFPCTAPPQPPLAAGAWLHALPKHGCRRGAPCSVARPINTAALRGGRPTPSRCSPALQG